MKIEQVIKTQRISSLELKATITLFYTNNWLLEKHQILFKKQGLTSQQYNVLRILRGQFPNPAKVSLIKERMLDKMSDTSRIIDRLEKNNWVKRNVNQADKRSVDVVITNQGLLKLIELDSYLPEMDAMVNNLTHEELNQLTDLLDKLRG
jgi:DNA-binding MarR family transcriptional regulator